MVGSTLSLSLLPPAPPWPWPSFVPCSHLSYLWSTLWRETEVSHLSIWELAEAFSYFSKGWSYKIYIPQHQQVFFHQYFLFNSSVIWILIAQRIYFCSSKEQPKQEKSKFEYKVLTPCIVWCLVCAYKRYRCYLVGKSEFHRCICVYNFTYLWSRYACVWYI